MSIKLTINLEQTAADLLTGYGAGAKLHVQRDTTSGFLAPADLSLVSIVSGTEQYEVWDSAGTSASWYRSRVENTLATVLSDWSPVFQATALAAYATLDDLRETMNFGATDVSKDNMLADLLVDASDYITDLCGRSFYRSPQVSGTETRLFHVVNRSERSLSRAVGYDIDLISVTTLEIADSTGGTYTTVAAGSTGYWLQPQTLVSGWAYTDLLLSNTATGYTTFTRGDDVVRIVGAFGWPSVPPLVKRATIDLAREWYRQGPGGGGPVGMSALGQPIFQQGMPPSVKALARSEYRRRSFVSV